MRLREASKVRRSSVAAGKRLKETAPIFCAVREIADAHPFCAVLGILRPVIIVSRGALDRLGDEELRAAIAHEAAHIQRYDQLLGALASFFTDLLPFTGVDLLKTYWEAREFAADQHAIAQTKVEALAGAIIALAKPSRLGIAALEGGPVLARLRHLLTPSVQAVSLRGRFVAAATLSFAIGISLLPIAAAAFGFLSCHMQS